MSEFFIITKTFCIHFCFILIPLLLLAFYRRSMNPIIAAATIFFVCLINVYLILFPRVFDFSLFHWNWEGKLLEFAWPLIFIYLFKWISPAEANIQSPTFRHLSIGLITGVILVLYAMFPLFTMIGSEHLIDCLPPQEYFNNETLLYQLTLPGLAEEVSRGFILAIFARYLGRQWSLFSFNIGWGAVLALILFILGHVIIYSTFHNQIIFNLRWLSIETILFSLTFVLLQETTRSIWPSVICHNLCNGLQVLTLRGLYIIATNN